MHRTSWWLAIVLVAGCVSSYRDAGVAYVDEFELEGASCGFGKQVTKLENGHGFLTHPESAVVFVSNGKVAAFDAKVGIVKGSKSKYQSYGKPTAKFRVWADGRIVADTGHVNESMQTVALHADLKGAREIVLETCSGVKWTDFPSADCNWLDAKFTYEAGATLRTDHDGRFEQLGILTPKIGSEPQFNGADIWGVRPNHPVIFRVPVSGERPMRFAAKGLPDGVILDEKGVLRGVAPSAKGDYDIEITAENAVGRAVKAIRLAVGDKIALTPPMGWNSWNVWGYGLTAERAKASALAMEKSGIGDYGWSYINLDDYWQMNNSAGKEVAHRMKDLGLEQSDLAGAPRDAHGRILPNRSFPDMKGLTDYIHGFGFKAGLYSSPGPTTCGGCEGSYGHEAEDAKSWADWGFDYIKYDWCSYDDLVADKSNGKLWYKLPKEEIAIPYEWRQRPYRLMNECLLKQNRDIVFSFCQYGMGSVQDWGRDAGAQCWRSGHDLKDTWTWMMNDAIEGFVGGEYWKSSGKGFWPDPDMMLVGIQRSFGYDHPTFLTNNEQYTHVSVWAMLSAPLLIGCDLTRLDDFTRSLLVNREVIAISQDRLGNVARRIRHVDAEDVWVKQLTNGDVAVALVNRSPVARRICVDWSALGIAGAYQVRDCWAQSDEGAADDAVSAEVMPHATKLYRLTPVTCRKCL